MDSTPQVFPAGTKPPGPRQDTPVGGFAGPGPRSGGRATTLLDGLARPAGSPRVPRDGAGQATTHNSRDLRLPNLASGAPRAPGFDIRMLEDDAWPGGGPSEASGNAPPPDRGGLGVAKALPVQDQGAGDQGFDFSMLDLDEWPDGFGFSGNAPPAVRLGPAQQALPVQERRKALPVQERAAADQSFDFSMLDVDEWPADFESLGSRPGAVPQAGPSGGLHGQENTAARRGGIAKSGSAAWPEDAHCEDARDWAPAGPAPGNLQGPVLRQLGSAGSLMKPTGEGGRSNFVGPREPAGRSTPGEALGEGGTVPADPQTARTRPLLSFMSQLPDHSQDRAGATNLGAVEHGVNPPTGASGHVPGRLNKDDMVDDGGCDTGEPGAQTPLVFTWPPSMPSGIQPSATITRRDGSRGLGDPGAPREQAGQDPGFPGSCDVQGSLGGQSLSGQRRGSPGPWGSSQHTAGNSAEGHNPSRSAEVPVRDPAPPLSQGASQGPSQRRRGAWLPPYRQAGSQGMQGPSCEDPHHPPIHESRAPGPAGSSHGPSFQIHGPGVSSRRPAGQPLQQLSGGSGNNALVGSGWKNMGMSGGRGPTQLAVSGDRRGGGNGMGSTGYGPGRGLGSRPGSPLPTDDYVNLLSTGLWTP
jgi:hypothetical protein